MKKVILFCLLPVIFIWINLLYLSEMQHSKTDQLVLNEMSLYCEEFPKSFPELSEIFVLTESSGDQTVAPLWKEASPNVLRTGKILLPYQVYYPVNEELLNSLKPELIFFLKPF